MKFSAPRGTADVLPEKTIKWKYLEKIAFKLFEDYGYREIITPTFEQTELFTRSIGESTEIVQKEMYTFLDRKGRSLTLRPEATASVVRAYLERNLANPSFPIKLYYFGPMYRYERPQAGRYREFWQLGVEAIGSSDPLLDAEVVTLLVQYLNLVGLKQVELHLNSMGCKKCRVNFVSALKEYLEPFKGRFCSDCQKRAALNPLRVFDCKEEACLSLLKDVPKIDAFLCDECKKHFSEVQTYLKKIAIPFKINPFLVRGFDYYTKTTFEVRSPFLGAQNALGGGGRYDDLIEELRGNPTPAIGFALGVERVLLALEKENLKLAANLAPFLFLAVMGEKSRLFAFELLYRLRSAEIASETGYNEKSLKAQMKIADRLGARYVFFIGEEELERQTFKVRDMRDGKQFEVPFEDVIQWVKLQMEGEQVVGRS